MTLPRRALVPTRAPVVIFQHGLTRWRGDVMGVANTLAARGLAAIAIDIIYHGGRAVCLADADCAAGVACTKAMGALTGTCAMGRFRPAPGAMPTVPGSAEVLPAPELPQRDFTNLANLFATRDNFRQHVIDLSQVVRVLRNTAATGLAAQLAANAALPPLDQAAIGYLGQSMGALLGSSFLALSPFVRVGVLNVGGGRVIDIFTDPRSVYAQQLGPFLAGMGIDADTPAYHQLVETLAWVMDPGDPVSLARHVRLSPLSNPLTMMRNPQKRVILQMAGRDEVLPNDWTRRLALELGLPVDPMGNVLGIHREGTMEARNVSTTFATARHGVLLDFADLMLTARVQSQAATYLATGLRGAPEVE
jgi:dienelactone hydrolase